MFSLDRSRFATAAARPASRTLLAAAALSVAVAAGAPAAAQAAPCFANLDGPGTGTWQVTPDGTLDGAAHAGFEGAGTTFDQGFGLLHVNGVPYPTAPNDSCAASGEVINFPNRSIGGMLVSRSVTSVGGALRYIDSITNQTNQFKHVTADFELAVLGSQMPVMSESGNASVNKNDHWAVLKSGGTFPFLHWGTDDALSEPDVDPADPQLQTWQHNFGVTDNATLRYEQIQVGAGQTVRLMHWAGATDGQPSATAQAQDGAKPFTDLSQSTAKQIVNWGPDADGDGVPVFDDDCLDVKGNGANGCLSFIAQPQDPQPPAPENPQPQPEPQPQPQPEPQPQPQPAPVPPAADQRGGAQSGAARDTRAPRVTLSGLGARATKGAVGRRGLRPKLTCDEACSLTVKVTARKRVRGKEKTVTLRTVRLSGRTVDPRTVALKLPASKLRGVLRRKLTVAMVATDASGNATRVVRGVKVSR